MLFIAPSLAPQLKNQKHLFSFVITQPEPKDNCSLFMMRETLINALREGKDRGGIDDLRVIDVCASTCGTNGHILFEYSPHKPIMNEDQIADLIQDAVIRINNKTGTVKGFTFGDLIKESAVKKTSLPFTAIQFGMLPNLLDLKKLPIANWENHMEGKL